MKVKVAVAGLILVALLGGLSLGAYLYLSQNFASELRDGLVAACENNGNPLRQGLREEKEAEIKEKEHPELAILEALHLTREQARDLAQPQIRKLRRDINTRYAPVDCDAQYPH